MRGRQDDAIIAKAAQLLRENPGMSKVKAAEEVGINESTLRYGLRRLSEAGVPGRGEPGVGDLEPEEIEVIHRDYSDLDELYIYPLSDVHKGSKAHHHNKWLEWIDYIAHEPNSSLLLNGDMVNAAVPNSKSDIFTEQMTVQEATEELGDELRVVKDRIDAIDPGNHEARVYRLTGIDPARTVARDLGIPYFQTAAMLVYKVGGVEYEVFVRHGTGGGGKRPGSKANAMEDSARIVVADVYVTGHTHTQMTFPEEIFVREGGRYVRRRQYFVASGSFLRYEDYAAERGMPPTKIGAPRIRLEGSRVDAHVTI